jgi:hypothetical protein
LIRVDRLLGEHGFQEDTPVSREGFEQRMERRRTEETDPDIYEPLRGGWCLGSESFRQAMRRRAEGSLGGSHAGEWHRQAAEAKAQRIIAQEPGRRGGRETDLLARRKKDPAKLAAAARRRREPPLSLKAIGARLGLGTSKSANGKLHDFMKGGGQHDPPGQSQDTFKLEAYEAQ